MSKKAQKTTLPRRLQGRLPRQAAKTATKRPAKPSSDATAERIADALEAIASHLAAASPGRQGR